MLLAVCQFYDKTIILKWAGGAGTFLMEHNGTFRKSGNFHAPTLSITRITKKYHGTFRNMPWGPHTPHFFQKKYQITQVYLSTFTKDTPT